MFINQRDGSREEKERIREIREGSSVLWQILVIR